MNASNGKLPRLDICAIIEMCFAHHHLCHPAFGNPLIVNNKRLCTSNEIETNVEKMDSREKSYKHLYNKAQTEYDLRWHRESIPSLLIDILSKMPAGSNVLDIGCGTGVYSCYMAEKGFNVTGIDFIERAIEFAKHRARDKNVVVDFQKVDSAKWEANRKYQLIFDSGCLHSMDKEYREVYKQNILKLANNQTIYILLHFGRRHFLDFSFAGPKRYSKHKILDFFSPEFKLNTFFIEPKSKGLFHYQFVKTN